jgi:hypothetical protein
MNKPELGKRYRIVQPEPSPADASGAHDQERKNLSVAIQYTFKPESFKKVRYADLTLDTGKEVATLSAGQTAEEVKVFKGSANVTDVKESMLIFDGDQFILHPVAAVVHSLKQVRDERYVGEETKRLNVTSFMKSLSKKKKLKASGAVTTGASEAEASKEVTAGPAEGEAAPPSEPGCSPSPQGAAAEP